MLCIIGTSLVRAEKIIFPCECNSNGTSSPCNSVTGKCNCKPHVTGPKCTDCKPEYFGFPNCKGGILLTYLYKISNLY